MKSQGHFLTTFKFGSTSHVCRPSDQYILKQPKL
jgi:hypothetical protein